MFYHGFIASVSHWQIATISVHHRHLISDVKIIKIWAFTITSQLECPRHVARILLRERKKYLSPNVSFSSEFSHFIRKGLKIWH